MLSSSGIVASAARCRNLDRQICNLCFSKHVFLQGKTLMKSARLGLLLTLAFTVGCGDSGPPLNVLTGTVSSSGTPLAEAAITFEDTSTGFANTADIKDGAYEIQLPDGSYTVTVMPAMKMVESNNGPPEEVYVNPELIADKYMSGRTSGLSYKMQGGGTYDVDLTK